VRRRRWTDRSPRRQPPVLAAAASAPRRVPGRGPILSRGRLQRRGEDRRSDDLARSAAETSHRSLREPASADDVAPTRERGATTRPFPSSRRLVTAAVRAGRRIVPMIGLFQVDLTAARQILGGADPPLSLTAYVVACVGRAAAGHPQVHAYRDWRGRLVEHRHVDVQVLIEVPTAHGPFGLVHVVRDADIRSVAEISVEIRAVKAHPSSTGNGRLLESLGPVLGRVPGLYRVMYAVMSRSHTVHDAIGTVQVTALGMFADGGGFAIAPPSLASLVVVVGGISTGPVEADGHIETVELLDLTVSIDHNVVDGAPATRFAADLRRIMRGPAESSPAG
jgi:pyruvate/2-oxoglutarate dehydrogenase complex dihydrolipoamide acyltransferase (E2) component